MWPNSVALNTNVNVQAIGDQGAFDVVLPAVKAQQVSGVAKDVARLL
jgi:hypothetical protein